MKNKNEILVDGVKYLVNPETKEATILKVRAPKPKKGDMQGLFEVPDTVKGYKVAAVGEDAFGGCKWIEGIIFCKNIREIHSFACFGKEKLRYVIFRAVDCDALPTIREKAFYRCENLRCIRLDSYWFSNRSCNYYLRRYTKYSPPASEDVEVLAEFMSKCESGAFAGCWKVPVELEEH